MSRFTIIVEDNRLDGFVSSLLQSMGKLPQIQVARKGDAFVVSPAKPSKNGRAVASVEIEFESLFSTWKKETLLSSDGDEIIGHPNYRKMIALGKPAVPLMLLKLKEDPQFLFDALSKITGADPIQKSHAGQLKKMAADWLDWGKQNGYDIA